MKTRSFTNLKLAGLWCGGLLILGGLLFSSLIVLAKKDPGWDFWDNYTCSQNLFFRHDSYHDALRELQQWDDSAIENTRWIDAVRQRITFLKKRGITTIQSHPATGAFYYLPFLFFELKPASTIYNLAQVFAFPLALIIVASSHLRIFSKNNLSPLFPTGIFYVLCLLPVLNFSLNANLAWENSNIFILVFISLFIYSFRTEQYGCAGFFLGLAVADKILPIMLLLAVSRKSLVRTLTGFALAMAWAFLFIYGLAGKVFFWSLVEFPLMIWESSYNILTSKSPQLEASTDDFSLSHYVNHINVLFHSLGFKTVNTSLIYGLYSCIIVGLFWLTRRLKDPQAAFLLKTYGLMALVFPAGFKMYTDCHLIYYSFPLLGLFLFLFEFVRKRLQPT